MNDFSAEYIKDLVITQRKTHSEVSLLLKERFPDKKGFCSRSVRRLDFRLRNPSSPDVVLVIKALFSIFDPHNRVETNMYFVFAYDFV